MKGMILAAGEGTRLRPLTKETPKPMLEVGGLPLIGHLVNLLRRHGVREIGINLHHKPEVVCAYLGGGSRFGVNITYSFEDSLLGSAGGLKRLEWFLNETFFVLYGDVLTDVDLSALASFHHRHGAAVTLALQPTDEPCRCGIVALDGAARVIRFQEKPHPEDVFSIWSNAGVCVVEPEVLELVPPDTVFDLGRHLIPNLLRRGERVCGCYSPAYFLDIGSLKRYRQAENDTLAGRVKLPTIGTQKRASRVSVQRGDSRDVTRTGPSADKSGRRRHGSGGLLPLARRYGS